MALFDCQAAALANQATNHLVGHMVPGRLGNAHPNIVPYQVFETSDGHLILAIANDRQFRSFCGAANLEQVAADPRFRTNGSRVDHREAIVGILKPVLAGRSTADWIARLEAANVPCGPINSIDKVFADPQAVARGLIVSMRHAAAGPIDLVASPLRLTKTPPEYRTAPPLLGEHTEDVLNSVLGLSLKEIKELRANGVI
jgi:crotonobetainyl-CoA:carnitine CoA-transferase CaiB-like acyl-CoA transferase